MPDHVRKQTAAAIRLSAMLLLLHRLLLLLHELRLLQAGLKRLPNELLLELVCFSCRLLLSFLLLLLLQLCCPSCPRRKAACL